MYKSIIVICLSFVALFPCHGQLTADQRAFELQSLASFYARNYAPAGWKQESLGFNLFDLSKWLPRVRAARDDLEFLELALEYAGSLEDTHTTLALPTNFSARLGFTLDIYDGKVVIDTVDRRVVAEAVFAGEIGDEMVSLDGKKAEDWVKELSRLRRWGNPVATARSAASLISSRPQSVYPRAAELGESANVEVRRANGTLERYTVPWVKTGTPLTGFGPVAPFKLLSAAMPERARFLRQAPEFDEFLGLQGLGRLEAAEEVRPRLAAIGQRLPGFPPPEGFVDRLGGTSSDFFYSGTYERDGLKIGYLRIPSFSAGAAQTRLLNREILHFNDNTDGLVVDVTRNPGGSCIYEEFASVFMPDKFRTLGQRFRPSLLLLNGFRQSLIFAELFGDSQEEIDELKRQTALIEQAYVKGESLTEAVPDCSNSFDVTPPEFSYKKPLVVLIDEFSISAADFFSALLKSNNRGVFVGKRANGAGGSRFGSIFKAGSLAELSSSVTITLGTTPQAEGSTATPYFENNGIKPDIELERMTLDNLTNNSRPFFEAFTKIAVDEIRKAKEAAAK